MDLFPSEHGEAMLYHDAGKYGFVKIGVKYNGTMREEGFPVAELPERIKYVPKNRDSYLTQAEFKRPRKCITDFLRTQLSFLDLDVYNMLQYKGRSPEELRDALLLHCSDNGIPLPSLIVFSGRGLYPKWFYDYPIPYGALAKWKRVQNELLTRLASFGPDRTKIHVGTILRIENTVNTKSGEVARVIWVNEDHGKVARWDFDTLADELLPLSREQLKEMRRKREEAYSKKGGSTTDEERETLRRAIEEANRHNRQLAIDHLALGRLYDLETIAKARFGPTGEVPEGERMNFMFVGAVCLSQIIKDPSQFYYELQTLYRKFAPSLRWPEVQSATSTIYRQTARALAGEKVIFNGRTVDPRYRLTNLYLLWLLHVTPEIERRNVTIIGREERKRRQRERAERVRREDGVLDIKTYKLKRQEDAEASGERAKALRAEGKNIADIARVLGKSVETVRSYLYRE
jgi:hypothetical protein